MHHTHVQIYNKDHVCNNAGDKKNTIELRFIENYNYVITCRSDKTNVEWVIFLNFSLVYLDTIEKTVLATSKKPSIQDFLFFAVILFTSRIS